MPFFIEVEQRCLQVILEMKNKAEDMILPDFTLYYKAIVTQTV